MYRTFSSCIALWLLLTISSLTHADFSQNKALLIGVDGMQLEKLQDAIDAGQAPALASFHLYKSWTGGIVGGPSEQPTFSGPGWTTLLTGTWLDRHSVSGNDDKLRSKAASLFKRIDESAPTRHTASIVSWNTINDHFADDLAAGHIEQAARCDGDDQCVVQKTVEALRSGNFDFIFTHIDQPDRVGHERGFSTDYQDSIHAVDEQIQEIMGFLDHRRFTHPDENWLVIVTTDHGRRLPDGRDHGGQTQEEKTTFIGINKTPNEQLAKPIRDPDNADFEGLYGYASQADVAPTILTHLGIQPDPAHYSIDGLPLIGPLGVRLLAASLDVPAYAVTLQWRTTAPGKQPIQIYRSGKLIATISGSEIEYVDRDLPKHVTALNYTVVMNSVPVSRWVKIAR